MEAARRRRKDREGAGERFKAVEIFERDGYICQECGIICEGVWPELDTPTLDHVIPISRGGEHTRGNTRCCCWGCNRKKADRLA